MSVRCGRYKHFKGNMYIVYGEAKTVTDELFVLYKQENSSSEFWIRPSAMFHDKVSYNGDDSVPRFKFISKINATSQIQEIINLLKKSNISLKHSETEEEYKVSSIDESSFEILISPIEISSSYLTDSQLAHRMGYDLYKVNGKLFVNKTIFSLLDRQEFEIINSDEEDLEYQTKKIITNQMNACSIDLHISDVFYKPKFKTIDMTNVMHHSVKPSGLWKRVDLKEIKGSKGIVLWPNQTIITCTSEKISLPLDCAGKIEIKSTYARLALSVTTSDFCNPGWKGHFPLTIKNNGNHVIVIHPKEKMLQLSLIPTKAPIINEYSKKGVFMDDDGTPFRFWKSQTIKRIGSKSEQEQILKFYENVMTKIEETSKDVESEKDRFQDTFLCFCEKKLLKKKFKDINDIKGKLNLLWKKYKQKERTLKFFFSKPIKFSALFVTIVPVLIAGGIELFTNDKLSSKIIVWGLVSMIIAAIIVIAMFVKVPNCYCTFEKLEFDKIYED